MSAKPSRSARWLPPASFYTEEGCSRCGVCCGSTDGHPCEHLRCDAEGAYFCEIYESRLGPHRTADGHSFVCVPIQTVIESSGGYPGCTYVAEIVRIRREAGQFVSGLGRREKP